MISLNIKKRERERETQRERERVAILAQVSHLCLEACVASLHRGRAGGFPWTVTPGEPSQFSQRCLSLIPDAAVLKRPF